MMGSISGSCSPSTSPEEDKSSPAKEDSENPPNNSVLWKAIKSFMEEIIISHSKEEKNQEFLDTLAKWCYYRDRFIQRHIIHPKTFIATKSILEESKYPMLPLEEVKKATISTYIKHINKEISKTIDEVVIICNFIHYHIDTVDDSTDLDTMALGTTGCLLYNSETQKILVFPGEE